MPKAVVPERPSLAKDANLFLDATYAHYLTANFITPGKPGTFAYFEMEPEICYVHLGLHVEVS